MSSGGVGSGDEVEVVADEAGVRDFIDVNALAYATYGMPGEALADLFDQPKVLLDDADAQLVVARRGGEPGQRNDQRMSDSPRHAGTSYFRRRDGCVAGTAELCDRIDARCAVRTVAGGTGGRGA